MGRPTRTIAYLALIVLSVTNFTLPSVAQSEDDLMRSPVGKVIAECAAANGTLDVGPANGAENILAATLQGKALAVRLYIDTRSMTVVHVDSTHSNRGSFTDFRNEIASFCGQTAADFLVPVVSVFERSAFAQLLGGCADGGKALHLYMGGADNTYMVALGTVDPNRLKGTGLLVGVVADDGWRNVEVTYANWLQQGANNPGQQTPLGMAMLLELHCGTEIAEQLLPQTYNEMRTLNGILPLLRSFTP